MNKIEEIRDWFDEKDQPGWELCYRDTANGINYDAREDMGLLLAVAEATAEWLAAIERFRDARVPIGNTRAVANVAQRRMVDALAPLLEETE